MICPLLLPLSSDLEIRHAAGMIIATKDQKNFFGDGSHMLAYTVPRTDLRFWIYVYIHRFPWWLRQERIYCNAGHSGLIPGKISWRREWLPIPVFLPGEFHASLEEATACQATAHGIAKSWTGLSD